MFYYLGRKCRLASKYPEPLHDTIVEPFCGSAAYSLHGERWRKNVILTDINPDVIDVWRYLQQASMVNVLELPSMVKGDKLSDHKTLSNAERWLIRYHINPGSSQNSNVCTAFGEPTWKRAQLDIACNLYKIKHWNVTQADYRTLDNVKATWFVDPPYHSSGIFYQSNDVSYPELAHWCMARNGQTIVCEQEPASWLPFRVLCHSRPARGGKVSPEMWFHREDSGDCFNCKQPMSHTRCDCSRCGKPLCNDCFRDESHECNR